MPSSRLSCSALCDSELVAVGPDPVALLADQQRDDLELGPQRAAYVAARDAVLDLAHGAGEHGDDALVVEVAHASAALGGPGAPGPALATSAH